MKIVRVLSVALAMAGVLFIWLSVAAYTKQRAFLDAAVRTPAEITEVARRTGWVRRGPIDNFLYKVRFTTSRGQTMEVFSLQSQSTPEYRVGDLVQVLYAPDDPRQAAIDRFSLLWFNFGVLLVFGGGFLAAGLGCFWIAGGSGSGRRTEFKLREIGRAFREGRLTRDSEYQGFLLVITFVGFLLLATAVSVALFGPTTIQIVVGGMLLFVTARIVADRRRRRRSPALPGST